MKTLHQPLAAALVASLSCVGAIAACGSDSGSTFDAGGDGDASGSFDGDLDAGSAFVDVANDAPSSSGPLGDVEAVVTCDNAYGFGWGDKTQMSTYFTAPASNANDIFSCPLGYPEGPLSGVGFGPEIYAIPSAQAPANAYLYIVAWADEQVTQGLLGQFKRSGADALYTGDPKWEVCATGIEYNANLVAGPTNAVVNQQITVCNAATGSKATSSAGWVSSAGAVSPGAVGKVAVGQDNSVAYPDGGAFPIACQMDVGPDGGTRQGIDPQAHWMWYSSSGTGDAFHYVSQDASRQFLIFRLATKDLPVPR